MGDDIQRSGGISGEQRVDRARAADSAGRVDGGERVTDGGQPRADDREQQVDGGEWRADGGESRETMTVGDVTAIVEELYPPNLAEPWDRVGLVAGDPADAVRRIALAVDPVRVVIDEALEWGADLLLTHHPLLLRPVSSVAADTFKGALVHRLIRGGCALLTAHTNADAAMDGVADALARAIGVTQELRPLRAGGEGDGREGDADVRVGIGRVGRLPDPMPLSAFVEQVAGAIPATAHGVRVAGRLDGTVSTVAVVGGAGDSLFDDVRRSGADVYVTADLRHHPASEARERAEFDGEGRPYLLDVSHAASEWPWLNVVARKLRDAARERGARLETRISTLPTDPWVARFG